MPTRAFERVSLAKNNRPSLPLMLGIAGVCLLAWMMFVVHLNYESMWSDEWFSWMYAIQDGVGELLWLSGEPSKARDRRL